MYHRRLLFVWLFCLLFFSVSDMVLYNTKWKFTAFFLLPSVPENGYFFLRCNYSRFYRSYMRFHGKGGYMYSPFVNGK